MIERFQHKKFFFSLQEIFFNAVYLALLKINLRRFILFIFN